MLEEAGEEQRTETLAPEQEAEDGVPEDVEAAEAECGQRNETASHGREEQRAGMQVDRPHPDRAEPGCAGQQPARDDGEEAAEERQAAAECRVPRREPDAVIGAGLAFDHARLESEEQRRHGSEEEGVRQRREQRADCAGTDGPPS